MLKSGGTAMKNKGENHFSFNDIIQFGLFILTLLTFVFLFCK